MRKRIRKKQCKGPQNFLKSSSRNGAADRAKTCTPVDCDHPEEQDHDGTGPKNQELLKLAAALE
jgi:hypothetical protein